MHWSEAWYGKSLGSKVIRTLLIPCSWVYSLGWRAYRGMYWLGLKQPAHPHGPILCVGTLTVGGAGKTPVTVYLAKLLTSFGYEVVVGCSGYGSPAAQGASMVPEGELVASKWGDEPALIRSILPDVPLIVGRDRVGAAQLCHGGFPGSILLMDDGLQHLPLAKDLSIVLDPELPNRRCLPAGPYREPWRQPDPNEIRLPGRFSLASCQSSFVDAATGTHCSAPLQANVLCAIASPGGFLDALASSGVHVLSSELLSDHAPLAEGNLFAGLNPEVPLIVTFKDWVKLRERADLSGRKILIAHHEIVIEPAAEFAAWIRQKLDEIISKGD